MTPTQTRRLFDVGIALKGLDGALQTAVGLLLAFDVDLVEHWTWMWINHRSAASSEDLLVTLLQRLSQWLTNDSHGFVVYFLLGHGVVKIFLAVQLLRERMWAFPVGIAVFGLFVVYQIHRFTITHSPGILFFSVLDIVVIALIAREWRLRAQGLPAPV